MRQRHRKHYSGTEGRGSNQNRCCSDAPLTIPVRTELGLTSSGWPLPMGLPYSGDPLSQYCQDRGHPLPSSLPGVRRLITEQQGGDGACVVLGHRREVGETGKSDQLPSTGQVAVRGRKEEMVILNCHTPSSIFWIFFRK